MMYGSEYEIDVDDQDSEYYEDSIDGLEVESGSIIDDLDVNYEDAGYYLDETVIFEGDKDGGDLSDEQKNIVNILSDRLLVIARAGSGKTRTLLHKAFTEIKQGAEMDHLLLLAFNRSAARQLNERMRERYGVDDFMSARTFHALAYNLLGSPSERLISNGDSILDEGVAKVNLVKEVIRTRLSVKDKIKYWWYLSSLGKNREVRGDEVSFLTLNGELVRSPWEKYIADFLFSCGISYKYEPRFQWNGLPYRPDFVVTTEDNRYIVIEHWGSNDDSYIEQVQRKRAFWQSRSESGYTLIETSMQDIKGHTEEEQRYSLVGALKSHLEQQGIRCELLSKEVVAERSVHKTINSLAVIMTQFISRAQVSHLSPSEVQQKANEYKGQQRFFYQFAGRVYEEYLQYLRDQNKIDFATMMQEATDLIQQTAGECELSFNHNNRSVKIRELKYIFVDEFQDFSQPYYEMVAAILKVAKGCKLWCVGDDWQAINQFAGSSTKYIKNFERFFSGGEAIDMHTNYRSKSTIIDLGNALMAGYGEPVQSVEGNGGGKCSYYMLSCKRDESELSTYVDCAAEIVKNHPDESIVFLARTKKILKRVSIDEFHHQLTKLLHQNGLHHESLESKTIHSYKGGEADVIVLLDYNKWHYPLMHPDRWRNEIFGENDHDVMDVERCLLYVAISRAKKSLYFITNSDDVPTEYDNAISLSS